MGSPISTSPTEWGIVAQWVLAFLTLLAVVVALLKEEIVRIWRRPKLEGTIKLKPPDCHKSYWTTQQPPIRRLADCYFLRLWVHNHGNVRAEKVQVFADKLLKQKADGTFTPVKEFLPMNLVWAYTHEIFVHAINPQMGKHCDLGHITHPDALVDLGEDHPDAPRGRTILKS